MRPLLSFLPLALAACQGDAIELGTQTGDVVQIEWSGTMSVDGALTIAPHEAVVALPGTRLELGPGARLVIEGSLTAEGTAEQPVVFEAPDGWLGIDLYGVLVGSYLQVGGQDGALRMAMGRLDLRDSVLDLRSPTIPPDCTSIGGGTVRLDHVRITGCHCPIHINQAASAEITNSVLDGAAVPVMLARLRSIFSGNDILGEPGMMDVGSGIVADIGGNYWGGGPPTLQTGDAAQFTGTDDWSPTPIEGAGPR